MTETTTPQTPAAPAAGASAVPAESAEKLKTKAATGGTKVPRRRRVVEDVDWTMSHGPVAAAVNAAGGAGSVAMLSSLAGAPSWLAPAAGCAIGVAAAVKARLAGRTWAAMTYRIAASTSAGGWAAWAMHVDPWTLQPWLWLGAGSALFGVLSHAGGHYEGETAQLRYDAAIARERVEVAVDWEKRITRVAGIKWSDPRPVGEDGKPLEGVLAVETWPGEGGMTLAVGLPKGGTTWRTLAEYADGLAADADLPAGCAVEVAPGKTRGAAFLRVQVVDRTAERQPYPDDVSPLSMSGPLPIGVRPNGARRDICILEDPVLAVARRGSGKTNLLDVVIANLARCPDVLKWAIDLNGGGLSGAWIEPWLDGRARRPVLDWVATTPEEAELMIDVAIEICKIRKTAYRKRMKAANDTKLPIDSDVPGIEITLDEAAEAVAQNRGNPKLAAKVDALMAISRAMRVQVVMSALRAESMTIPPNLKHHAGTKIALRPEDEAEVANLLGWGLRGVLTDVARPGMALIRDEQSARPEPIKIFEILPDQKERIAVACADRQPDLDAPSLRAAGEAYAKRWQRYFAWGLAQGDDAVQPTFHAPVGDDADGDPTTTETGAEMTTPDREQPPSLADAAEAMQASRDRMREVRERYAREHGQQGPGAEPSLDQMAADLAAEPSRQDWVRSLLREAGPGGVHWERLSERLAEHGHEVSRATLYRDLKAMPDAEQTGAEGCWRLKG